MDPYENPVPGTSHSWEDPAWNTLHIEETLRMMDSFNEEPNREDTNLRIHSPQYPITDSELFGILSENVIDELETDNDGDFDFEFVEEDTQQNYVAPDEAWMPGNPQNSNEFPFVKSPGLKEDVGDEPIQYFDTLCTSQLLELLKDCSNEYGENEKTSAAGRKSRKISWKPVTCQELKLFFGLIFHMGFVKLNRFNDYWKNDEYFNQTIFRKAMSRNRFMLILRMLCVYVGQVTCSYDKVKNIIDYFNEKMISLYYPTQKITIDESMMLWRGRLTFRQYMKGKRHKYGLKFYALADQLGVIMKLHLYGGASDYLVGGKNHVQKVVDHLLSNFINVGHHLFIDNFYTSVSLVEKLYASKTFCTGTLRQKRKNNPREIELSKLKKGELCIVHKNNICVLKWKDQREIRVISSKYNGNLEHTRNRRGTLKLKPQMVIKYNKSMKAIDRHDQMLSYYSCEHKSIRWYKKVILHVMQILLVNSFFLYNKCSSKKLTLYDFRLSVIKSIVEPHLPSELQMPLKNKVHCIMKLTKDTHGKTKRRRCNQCWRTLKKRVQTIFACEDCPGQPGLCIECFRPYHSY